MVNLFAISATTIGIIVGAVILFVIIVIAFVGMRNGLIRLRNNVEEGWATIDVYLKKRYDLIPNLVETVKGYAKHESATLEAIVDARNRAMSSQGDAKIDAENQITAGLKSLFALSERYPDLKANTQFLNLQSQLQVVETDLAQSRKYYNANVKIFNTKIELFPSNLVAAMMKLQKRKYFETLDQERENIKVSF